ncbi:uncharacterized protein LOC106881936 [Octopus bimaculoides]|uniref:uncharacterized protein LOC106881936 n=1 Tax=Octopus bimaculoides TaxID=37653 RepID=UPI0022E83662|nr:uncharacterized protein LOC106881936 [Octopus bimaculoides]
MRVSEILVLLTAITSKANDLSSLSQRPCFSGDSRSHVLLNILQSEPMNGCQESCSFYRSKPRQDKKKKHWKKFIEKPRIQLLPKSINISWMVPHSKTGHRNSTHFVYILLCRHLSREWSLVDQTYLPYMEVSLTNLTESSQFWLLAVNSFGVVAEERFPVKSIRRFREVFSENAMKSKSESSKRRSRGKLFYILEKITEINNSLSVVLQMREKSGLTSQAKNRNIDYYVNWFLENCGIYKDVRKCGLPKQHYGPVHNSSAGRQKFKNGSQALNL